MDTEEIDTQIQTIRDASNGALLTYLGHGGEEVTLPMNHNQARSILNRHDELVRDGRRSAKFIQRKVRIEMDKAWFYWNRQYHRVKEFGNYREK